jgi:hypothetical protein
MLEILELKSKQGYWPHLIEPALEGMKQRMAQEAKQESIDELYKMMQNDRPPVWKLNGGGR